MLGQRLQPVNDGFERTPMWEDSRRRAGKRKSGDAGEGGSHEEEMGPGIGTLVAEEAEQDHDARADSGQADDNVDEHQWWHARDHSCDPPNGERVRVFEADTTHEISGCGVEKAMEGGDTRVSRAEAQSRLKPGYMLLSEAAEEAVGFPGGTRVSVGYTERKFFEDGVEFCGGDLVHRL